MSAPRGCPRPISHHLERRLLRRVHPWWWLGDGPLYAVACPRSRERGGPEVVVSRLRNLRCSAELHDRRRPTKCGASPPAQRSPQAGQRARRPRTAVSMTFGLGRVDGQHDVAETRGQDRGFRDSVRREPSVARVARACGLAARGIPPWLIMIAVVPLEQCLGSTPRDNVRRRSGWRRSRGSCGRRARCRSTACASRARRRRDDRGGARRRARAGPRTGPRGSRGLRRRQPLGGAAGQE